MNNPYDVLGISPSASDAEVKAAYRELAKKYHPDHYVDNPLSDLAQEKMKEINEAYDAIIRQRQQGTGGQYHASSFADIRQLISQRRFAQAEELLDGVPSASRNAEWHYLKGHVLYQKGWLEEANRYFHQAVQMDPQNPEYRAAVNRSQYQRTGGYRPQTSSNDDLCGSAACDLCQCLICTNCCCDCLGGNGGCC